MFTTDQINAIAQAVAQAVAETLASFNVPQAAAPVAAVASLAPAPIPAPAPTPTITYSNVGGWRVDDIVPTGTPGTETLATGHVLSSPMPNAASPTDGEMAMGYLFRVSRQCGQDPTLASSQLGRFVLESAALFEKVGGYHPDGLNWPEAADRFWNPVEYFTAAEKADVAKNAVAWAAYTDKMQRQRTPV